MVEGAGLVLIGPGSEWVWGIVSNVVLIVTLVALYIQVRAQRAATVFEQFNTIAAQWDTKEFRFTRLQALLDLEGRSIADGLPDTGTPGGRLVRRPWRASSL